MDFFFELFDSEKKRRAAQQQADNRNRTGSGGELPPLRIDGRGHHHFSFRKYDTRETNRVRDERTKRELHRLYLWDSEYMAT